MVVLNRKNVRDVECTRRREGWGEGCVVKDRQPSMSQSVHAKYICVGSDSSRSVVPETVSRIHGSYTDL